MEYTGILARSVDPKPARLAVDWARSARIGGHDVLLVANGAGQVRAGTAVETASPFFRPDAVMSTGFCGALDASLAIADVVVGTSASYGALEYLFQPVDSGAPHCQGAICSIDHVAQTGAEKARLYASGAIAVEMEAAGVARCAEEFDLPVYCVRAVTDLADEDMANDFNGALRPDGHFDTIRILGSALRHPWVRVPELIRLRQRCVRAAHVLGDFIADCRF